MFLIFFVSVRLRIVWLSYCRLASVLLGMSIVAFAQWFIVPLASAHLPIVLLQFQSAPIFCLHMRRQNVEAIVLCT